MENNKDLFYKLVGEAKEIKLTERERNSLISAVDAFVLKNPIKKDISIDASTNPQPIKSPFLIKIGSLLSLNDHTIIILQEPLFCLLFWHRISISVSIITSR